MSGSPARIGSGLRIAVGVRERDGGHRPPGHFGRHRTVETLAGPGGDRGLGHGDIQDGQKPVAGGHREMTGGRDLVGGLVPVDAGVPVPEERDRRLFRSAGRSRAPAERLDRVEIVRVGRGHQTSRRFNLELRVAGQHERRGEGQALRAHRGVRRRCRTPLAGGGAADERRIARAEPVVGAPGEHRLRHLRSPGDAAFARSPRLFVIVAQCRERGRIAVIERRLSRRKQPDQRRVRGGDDGGPARRAIRGPVVDEDRLVPFLDAVVRVEDRRVHDGAEPLTRGVRGIGGDERVDEDLIPFQHLVAVVIPSRDGRWPRDGRPLRRWRHQRSRFSRAEFS